MKENLGHIEDKAFDQLCKTKLESIHIGLEHSNWSSLQNQMHGSGAIKSSGLKSIWIKVTMGALIVASLVSIVLWQPNKTESVNPIEKGVKIKLPETFRQARGRKEEGQIKKNTFSDPSSLKNTKPELLQDIDLQKKNNVHTPKLKNGIKENPEEPKEDGSTEDIDPTEGQTERKEITPQSQSNDTLKKKKPKFLFW